MAKEIDPQDLIALDRAQAKHAEAQRLTRQLEVDDFKWLVGNKQGRRFLWRLLSKAGLFHCALREPHEQAFYEGMRNLGLVFWTDLHEICPEKYSIMVKEAQDNDNRIAAIRRS